MKFTIDKPKVGDDYLLQNQTQLGWKIELTRNRVSSTWNLRITTRTREYFAAVVPASRLLVVDGYEVFGLADTEPCPTVLFRTVEQVPDRYKKKL